MSSAIIQPYLFFSGRCEEAINFYMAAVAAKLVMIMRYNESPESPPPGMLEEGFENKVMHATLQIGESIVMLSDGCDSKGKLDGFRLSLAFESEAEARSAFDELAKEGSVQMPLTKTFWSPCFGMLTDRFGLGWMITIKQASPQ